MAAPQPQPQIRVRTIRTDNDKKESESNEPILLSLSEFLSDEVFTFIENLAPKLQQQKRNVLTIYDAFLELVKNPIFANDLKTQNINILEAEEKIISTRNSKQFPIESKGILYFSPNFKLLLLEGYKFVTGSVNAKIQLKHIWQALMQNQEISLLVFNKKPEAIEQTPQNKSPQTKPLPTTEQNSFANIAPNVSKLSEDVTQIQKASATRPIIGREQEINQILRIISREEKNHCLLLGENGVGKSALIEGLAYELIHNQQIPEQLKKYRVLKLNFAALLASAEFPGSNLPDFMEEINKIGSIILYLEGTQFNNSASQEQYVFNTFLSLIFRNKAVIVIIASEPDSYMANLQKDSLVSENFEVIKVEEPRPDVLKQIITSELHKLSAKHTIQIDPSLIDQVITLADRYMGSQNFPQKGISLLEEAVTASKLAGQPTVTIETIRNVLAEKTGIPIQSISVSDREKLLNLENELNSVVIGQSHAVREIVEAIKRSRAGLKDQKKPIGSFLFLGPTGVGKTELAKQLAVKYYNDDKAFVRLDMSEYGEQHTSQRLIGSPPGYTGYEEGGQFTNPIIQRPYSLILLDEIEKAHPKIFDIFLQVLDEGRLTDSRGRLADFRNAILIFTSNIASEVIFKNMTDPNSKLKTNPKEFYEQDLLPELLKHFRPELINRFDEVIPFNPLGPNELLLIAKLKLKPIQTNLKERGIMLNATDEELMKLVQAAYDPRFGARPIERMIKDKVETPIAQQIVSGSFGQNSIINWRYEP